MTLRPLALQFALAVGVLAACNLAVRWLARNSVPRQVLARGQSSDPATDLFVGNSTMAAGLDEQAFAAAKPGRPLNLGLGSSSPVEHLLILRQQARHDGAAVYYGFLDFQLTDTPAGGWGELVGNRAMAYYIEPGVAAELYHPNESLAAVSHRVVGGFLMLVERTTVWAKVEQARRVVGECGMPKREVNRFGRAEDFTLLEGQPEEFAARCEAATRARTPLNEPTQRILAKASGRVYVVLMPMPSEHRRRYYSTTGWAEYLAGVVRQAEAAGAVFVPAADWVEDDGFADALHLNDRGAADFSRRLGEWVRRPAGR